MQLDLSQDYLVWDNTESVVYQSTRNTGSMQDTLASVKRRALTNKELAASAGAYQSSDVVLLIPAVQLAAGFLPKVGDAWIDAQENVFTVLEVGRNKRDKAAQEQTYRLTCRNLAIHFDLEDTIDIQRATVVYDAAGSPVKQFPPDGGSVLFSAMPSRVQPLDEEIKEERGIRGDLIKYNVFCSRPISSVSTEDRIVVKIAPKNPPLVGRILEVRGWHNAERVDELPVIDAELLP